MKRMLLLMGAALAVTACANDYECGREYVEETPCGCKETAPVYQPRYEYQPAPAAYVQPESPCQGEVRTMREPVEVVYKRTTYGTVYEPRHFENVSYERQVVNGETYTYEGYPQPVYEGYAQPTEVRETSVYSEQEYIVPAQPAPAAAPASAPAPAAPARKYNGPVVVVPTQH